MTAQLGPWASQEWDSTCGYIIVKWKYGNKKNCLGQCIQRFFDFKKEYGCMFFFEEKEYEPQREVQARFVGRSEESYQIAKDRITMMEVDGSWFDEVEFLPVSVGKDEPSVITLTWGLEYSKEWAVRKLTYGINNDMGDSWALDTFNDGVMTAIYVAPEYNDFVVMVDKMKHWKESDRIAYSSMDIVQGKGTGGKPSSLKESENEGTMIGKDVYVETATTGQEFIQNEHGGEGGLALIRHKKNAWPVNKYKSRWYQNKLNDDQVEEWEMNLSNKVKRLKAGSPTLDDTTENVLYRMHQEENAKQERSRAEADRVRQIPPMPDNEYDLKVERVYHPMTVALRGGHGCDDGGSCRSHPLHKKWSEHCRKYGVEMLPIGGGEFFNGYFVIGKKDFFFRNQECGPHYREWRPITCGLTGVWSNYEDWYWTRAIHADLDDDRFDSDGNTVHAGDDDDEASLVSGDSVSLSNVCGTCGGDFVGCDMSMKCRCLVRLLDEGLACGSTGSDSSEMCDGKGCVEKEYSANSCIDDHSRESIISEEELLVKPSKKAKLKVCGNDED